MTIIINLSNRHMDQRIFGKELTNICEGELNRYKRNYSFLHGERGREHSVNLKQGQVTHRLHNRSQQDAKLP